MLAQGGRTVLMDEAIRRAAEAGWLQGAASLQPLGDDAHAFYETLGFEAPAEGFRLYLI